MNRFSFPRTSFFLRGIIAFTILSFVFGLVFHSRLASNVFAQEASDAATNPDTLDSKATSTDIFLQLAATVGQTTAAKRLVEYKLKNDPTSSLRYYAIVDFDQPSTSKRLYVFDTIEKKVNAYYVAHGRGSEGSKDDGIAEVFSNLNHSNSSSLGIYRTLNEYNGNHGRALRLEGLESTNSNAFERAVVMHTADYVSESFIRRTGRLGRSEGCFAVDKLVGDSLVDELKNGTYIIASKN